MTEPKRRRRGPTTWVALATLMAAVALVVPPGAAGSAPASPPGCAGNSFSFANNTPVPITGGVSAPPVTSTIQVSGAQRYLRDADVITDISHSHSADLDVTLTSPAGTVVTLTTDNGEAGDNVFGNGTVGTRWDDDAGEPVTDTVLVNNVPTPSVVPEEAMAAFVGEDPNGTWTLKVADDSAPDNGQLNRWSLELATLNGTPVTQTSEIPGVGAGPIPNPGLLTAAAVVAGAGAYVADVELFTDISHEASGDLDVSVRSPSATISKISTGNGASFDDVFGGIVGAPTTRWFDKAGATTPDDGGGPVTDASFVNDVVETHLVPEEAMGAFVGEDPNGSWSLDVVDRSSGGFGGDSGTLNAWSLKVTTVSGCSPPPNRPPVASAGGPYTTSEGESLALDGSGSSDPDTDPLTYSWDVNGDGTFGDASGQNPTLTWNELKALGIDDGPNTFQVKVLVSDSGSSTTSSATQLTLNNAAPSLEITGPDSPRRGQSIEWTFAASDPSPGDQAGSFTYRIDWDGDGIVDETVNGDDSVPVSHTYPTRGDFTIKATATDKDGGESAQDTKAVSVVNNPPVASAGGPYATAEGGSVALDASGSSDADSDALTYSWDVNGDGTFGDASGQKPTLTWDELKALGIDDGPANLQVKVRVSDADSSTDSAFTVLTVSNAVPSLEITGPDNATAGQTGTWTFAASDQSPDDQAGSFTYRIDWDGDGTVDQTVNGDDSTPVQHAYAAAGDLTIKATAADKDGGESAQDTKAVSVAAAPAGSGGNAGPGTGGAQGGAAPGSVLDLAPVVDDLSLTAQRFGVAGPRTAVSAQRRRRLRRLRRGTTIRYSLSEPATAHLRIERALPGRRVGRRCRRPSRRLRSRRRCRRYRRAGTLVRRARAGRNATAFSGRIGRRALRPGRYRLVVTAIDRAGKRSRPRYRFFTILRG